MALSLPLYCDPFRFPHHGQLARNEQIYWPNKRQKMFQLQNNADMKRDFNYEVGK